MNESIKKLSLALEELRIKIEDKIDADGGLLIIDKDIYQGLYEYDSGYIYAIARTMSGDPHACATEMEVYFDEQDAGFEECYKDCDGVDFPYPGDCSLNDLDSDWLLGIAEFISNKTKKNE
jgi:hypothetical protein